MNNFFIIFENFTFLAPMLLKIGQHISDTLVYTNIVVPKQIIWCVGIEKQSHNAHNSPQGCGSGQFFLSRDPDPTTILKKTRSDYF